MDFAWFMYTIALMVVTVAACAVNLTVWVLAGRRDCLAAGAAFMLYTLDVGTILYDEYVRLKPLGDAYFEQGLVHPVFQIVLNAALVLSVWLWAALRLGLRVPRSRWCLLGLGYLALTALVAPVGSNAGTARTMAYWALRDLAALAVLAMAVWRYATTSVEHERANLRRHSRVFFVAAALVLLMTLEDAFNILVFRPDLSVGIVRDFLWHFTERNLSENVLVLLLAVCSIREARDIMRVFARHPAHDAQTLEHERVRPDFESRLLSYADDHGMSNREREVLALVLQGKDIQNIASELVISVGTVKAHLHRIYRKAEVGNRKELLTSFWQG